MQVPSYNSVCDRPLGPRKASPRARGIRKDSDCRHPNTAGDGHHRLPGRHGPGRHRPGVPVPRSRRRVRRDCVLPTPPTRGRQVRPATVSLAGKDDPGDRPSIPSGRSPGATQEAAQSLTGLLWDEHIPRSLIHPDRYKFSDVSSRARIARHPASLARSACAMLGTHEVVASAAVARQALYLSPRRANPRTTRGHDDGLRQRSASRRAARDARQPAVDRRGDPRSS